MIINLIILIILSIMFYYSQKITLRCSKHKFKIISFGAGLGVTYVFLHFIPNIIKESIKIFFTNYEIIFFPLLAGFVFIHLINKYIHIKLRKNTKIDALEKSHDIMVLLYGILAGLVISSFQNFSDSILLFVPIALHTVFGELSFHGMHKNLSKNKHLKIVVSLSPLIGLFLFLGFEISAMSMILFMGLLARSMLYFVIREAIPKENKGQPLYFILGMAIYLLILTWSVIL